MGALPKKKISKRRRGNRRAHSAINSRQLSRCDNCNSLLPSHLTCPVCGHYRSKEIYEMDQPKVKFR